MEAGTLYAAVRISTEISTLEWNSSSIHLLLCYQLWNMNFSFYYFWGGPLFAIWSGVGEEFEQNMIHEIFKSNISVSQSVVNSVQLYYLVLIKFNLNLFDKTFPSLKESFLIWQLPFFHQIFISSHGIFETFEYWNTERLTTFSDS